MFDLFKSHEPETPKIPASIVAILAFGFVISAYILRIKPFSRRCADWWLEPLTYCWPAEPMLTESWCLQCQWRLGFFFSCSHKDTLGCRYALTCRTLSLEVQSLSSFRNIIGPVPCSMAKNFDCFAGSPIWLFLYRLALLIWCFGLGVSHTVSVGPYIFAYFTMW